MPFAEAWVSGSRTLWDKVRRWGILLGVLLAILYAYAVVTAGGRDLAEVLFTLDPFLLSLPLLATLLSYVTMSLSYEGIARAAGSEVRSIDMLRITFVSNTVNYIVATGGLSGFAVRMYFFQRHGIPVGRHLRAAGSQDPRRRSEPAVAAGRRDPG